MFNMLVREYPYNAPIYTHEEMMKILQVKARAIENFLEQEKPYFVFMTAPGSINSMLLYQMAKRKNIKVFVCMETRIGNGYALSHNHSNFSFAEEKFERMIKNNYQSELVEEAKAYIKQFREKPKSYVYYDNMNDLRKNISLKSLTPVRMYKALKFFVKMTAKYLAQKRPRDYSTIKPHHFFIDNIKRKIRTLIGFDDLYDKIDPNDDYAFFPLHFEPETAILLLAPFWTDQINLIRQIARSLPIHFKLYVKEHPSMVGFRPRSYYKEIKKIPNVKLINHRTGAFELIQKAKLITTITGTAGWESVLFKRPVIVFGDVFYNKLSFVKRCRNIESLPIIINDQLYSSQYNEDELEKFIAAIMEESANIGLAEIWETALDPKIAKSRLELLADLLSKKLNLSRGLAAK